MTEKKRLCFPLSLRFGGLLHYTIQVEPGEKETEECYSKGELIVGDVKWVPQSEFEKTLIYNGFSRGCTSAKFWWYDKYDEKEVYPMFMKEMDELIWSGHAKTELHGIFCYIKRGQNYGIKLVKEV